MRKLFLSLILAVWTAVGLAQESAKPTFDVKTERFVADALINGEMYYNVTVKINAAAIDEDILEGVSVVVKDENGERIYRKRFFKSYLYGFSDGTLQVGKGNALTNMIIFKDKETRQWHMELRDKGIY